MQMAMSSQAIVRLFCWLGRRLAEFCIGKFFIEIFGFLLDFISIINVG